MTEVWLHSNRRVLLLATAPVGVLGGLGLAILSATTSVGMRILAWLLLATAVLLVLGLVQQLLRPRVAYREGEVLFYLKAGGPVGVPVNVVEAFFLGQGPAHLPGDQENDVKTANLVARLSQRETQWAHKEVKPALGSWSDGYITIRGTWCEPLNGDVLRRLNRRLGEVTRARKIVAEGETTA